MSVGGSATTSKSFHFCLKTFLLCFFAKCSVRGYMRESDASVTPFHLLFLRIAENNHLPCPYFPRKRKKPSFSSSSVPRCFALYVLYGERRALVGLFLDKRSISFSFRARKSVVCRPIRKGTTPPRSPHRGGEKR